MDRNAVILAVTLSFLLLADARLDPSADEVAVSVPDPREDAATVSVDLRPLRATSLPLTAIRPDRDISRQIAHSLRLPHLNRHAPRPHRLPPVELPYGNDMIQSSKFEEKEEGFKKKKKKGVMKKERDDDSDSDSDDEDEEGEKMKKRLRKMMKKKLKTEREKDNGGIFKKWISRFLN